MNFFKSEKLLVTVLVLFSAAIFLIGLGRMPLTDPDEVFYAETAKEMLNRGELLTQYIFGKPQFEKPPLYYWMVIASFRVFGVNEFSARFPSAIIGILGIIGIYLLGKSLMNKRAGFIAGLALATCVEYLILARACVTDMLLGTLILYAFLFFFYGYLHITGKTKYYLLSSVFLGLAVLAKGPVGVFLPVAIIVIYLIMAKELKKLKEMPIVLSIVIFLAVSLPWYLLMYKVHGAAFMDGFFGFHNITRFLQPEHAIGDVIYYYVPIVIGGFLPWAAFLPIGAWYAFGEKDKNSRKTNLFLAIWFLFIFIFFTISRTKLPTYIFPLFPVLALLTGGVWDAFLGKRLNEKQEKSMRIAIGLFSIVLIGSMAALCVIAKIKYPAVFNASIMAAVIFAIFIAFLVRALLKERYPMSLAVYITSFAVLTFLLSYTILPELGKYEASKHASKRLMELAGPNEKFGAETRYIRGVAFYTDRENILNVHQHDVITKFLKRKERVWCLVKEKNYNQLYDDRKNPFDKTTYVLYKFGKKVIITNEMPLGREYIRMRSK